MLSIVPQASDGASLAAISAGGASNTPPANATYTPSPRSIAAMVDWLTVTITSELPRDQQAYFYALVVTDDGAPQIDDLHQFAGEDVTVRLAHDGALRLHNDYVHLAFRVGPGDTTAELTLYPLALWEFGVEGALARAQAFLDGIFGEVVFMKLGRVDLCRDMVGMPVPQCSLADLAQAFVTRARSAKGLGESSLQMAGKLGTVQTVYIGSRRAACHARIYNKSAELLKTRKDYYTATWQAGEYDALRDGPITRVEFELHTSFWREWRTDDGRALEDAHELVGELNAVWHYLTSKWLRVVDEDSAISRKSRRPDSASWAIVAERFVPWCAMTQGDRVSRRAPQVAALLDQIAGCARTLQALHHDARQWTPRRLARTIVAGADRYIQRHGLSWEQLVVSRQAAIFAGLQV